MNDSRTNLARKTKRELVALLLEAVTVWPGDVPLEKAERERAEAVLAMLRRCRLWFGEEHWLGLCGIWVSRSAHPDKFLREFLLTYLQHWLCFLDEIGFEADSLPDLKPPLPIWRPAPPSRPLEPGHLPFGFVRPMTG